MTKNDERDSVVRAFRRFARLGLHRQSFNTLRVGRVVEACCARGSARLDMLAVYDTLRILYLNGEDDVISAVSEIYFSTATHRIAKNEISRRVCRYASESFCDERTVYRRLLKARKLYARVRERESEQFSVC